MQHTELIPWQYRARPTLFVAAGLTVSVLLAMGLLLAGRRVFGGIEVELPLGMVVTTALVTVGIVVFLRIAWRRNFPLESPTDLTLADRLLGYGSSISLILLCMGCCYPGNRNAEWLAWLPLLVADQFWRQNFFDAGKPWVPLQEQVIPKTHNSQDTFTEPLTEKSSTEDIVQQLYRLRDEQGREVIYGTVRADFVAGQRMAVAHVGFCPPLPYLPEIEAEALPGHPAKIKVVQAMAHGTRLDVRLSSPAASDCQVWIDLAARPKKAV